MTRQRGWMAAVVIVIAAGTVGCGLDPSRAPVDAKKDDFCRAWTRLARADGHTSAADMKDYLNEFARFGTPRGIPTAARNGYEYAIDPNHEFANGAQFGDVATRTDRTGQDAAALKRYATAFCA